MKLNIERSFLVCLSFLSLFLFCIPSTVQAAWSGVIQVPGVGFEGQGAGIAVANLDSNPRPEIVLMAYDNPPGANTFRYKIGWNVNTAGVASSWSALTEVPGVGFEGQGAGIAVANLDSNPRPEIVLMAYDNPPGANTFRYKIGWNVNTAGVASSWSALTEVPGVGFEGQGAGIAVANLDSNPRPEIVLMAYDNPPGPTPSATRLDGMSIRPVWPQVGAALTEVPGVGFEGQGAGIAVANLDSNPRPEIVLMAYDNPPGANTFRYKIGWNVNTAGVASSWSALTEVPGVGWEGQGADLSIYDINGDGKPDIILMAYDNPLGGNSFRYKIGWDVASTISREDNDNQFVGYVSNEEDRFTGYVWGFVDEFKNTWTNTQYYWGECRFLQNDQKFFVDSADLAYIAGHGGPSYIWISSTQCCDLTKCAWGSYSSADRTGDLEYIVFHSCEVLKMDAGWRDRWRHTAATQTEKRPFSGLHIAMGFRTNHYNGAGAGRAAADDFAENLEDGHSVRLAWYEAVEDNRWLAGWQENKPAIFYIRPHKDETISQHNSTDYKYGDPEYLLDAYYME